MSTVDIWFVNLGIRFSDWAKSFRLFGLDVYFYGAVIACSVLAGLGVALYTAKKTNQKADTYWDLMFYGVIFGVIGARLYYVIFAWDYYKDDLKQIFNLRGGGLAIYGGVIAAVLTVYLFCKKRKLKFPLVIDTAICGLITGQCTGRWSNFFNMEAFGGYTDGPFAMALNLAKVNPNMVTADLLQHSFAVDGVTYIQVHPTFLYESLWSLATLILLLVMTPRKKFDGEIVLLYFIGYGSGRFWIEGLRTDQLTIGSTGLAVSQLLSGVLVISAAVLLVLGLRKAKHAAAVQTEAVPAGQEKPAAEAGTEEEKA